MRGWIATILIGLLPLSGLAQPASAPAPAPGAGSAAPGTASPAQLAQQERMRSCNAEAGTRKLNGEPRRSFMRECLAAPHPAGDAATPTPPATNAAPQTQQDRMRSCNAQATSRELAGQPRRDFMRGCLSGPTTPAAAAPAGSTPAAGRNGAVASNAQTYTTEAAAKAGCGEEPVVWGNSDSRIFHLAGSRLYGHTQNGAYLCRGPAELAGYRAAR
jgi:hypothetical protein